MRFPVQQIQSKGKHIFPDSGHTNILVDAVDALTCCSATLPLQRNSEVLLVLQTLMFFHNAAVTAKRQSRVDAVDFDVFP